MVTPLVTQQIEDFSVTQDSDRTTVDLTTTFDDPSTTGQIARFEFADNVNDGGVVDVLLFDQSGVGAPATVENFLNYVEDEDYDDTIVHRSVTNFIVQGGGFAVENSQVVELPADEAVVNEFSADRSNLVGTIAMAKLGGNPDSATNQWFFNLGDNSSNLDNQNGGFTVFGQVLGDEDLETVNAIDDLERVNGVPVVGSELVLDDVPITDATAPITTDDFVTLDSVSSIFEDELEFSVVSNSNEELVETSITDDELTLDYVDGQSGEATITLEATNLLGETVEEEFMVTVEETPEVETPEVETPEVETPEVETPEVETPEVETPEVETPEVEIPEVVTNDLNFVGPEVFRFLNPDTGIHFYADSEAERDELLEDEPDLVAEDLGYRTVNPEGANAQEVFSFFNQDTGAYLYTVDENEREFIEENFDNYTQESDSFSVFAVDQPELDTIPVYRFLDINTGAHFYTSSAAERETIENNFSNYNSEGEDGIAFYAFDADV